jgi:hypothetical protein
VSSKKPATSEAAVIAFRDGAEFEAWLAQHVDLQAGVWLKIAKKGSGIPSLTDDEAVDLGLKVRAPQGTQPLVAGECGQGRNTDRRRANASVRLG